MTMRNENRNHQDLYSGLVLGQIQFVNNLSCLYPTYVRGEAYLAAGKPSHGDRILLRTWQGARAVRGGLVAQHRNPDAPIAPPERNLISV